MQIFVIKNNIKTIFFNPKLVQEPRVISRPIEDREAGPFNEILRREVGRAGECGDGVSRKVSL